jgi:polyphenol oxidase
LLKSKRLSKFSEISHCFFSNNGGVSKGIYKSLNCGIGSKDKKTNVKKNLNIVKSKFGVKKTKQIILVKQIHSNKFIYLNKNSNIKNRSISADAIISEKKKIPIAVLTADCVPILIFDKKRKMIAAIHAGWRGAFKGIIHKVVKFMLDKGCDPKNMTVAIGPCISRKNYEVKKQFKENFIKKDKKNIKFFVIRKKKIYFDLTNYVKKQVKLNLVENIDIINIDTFNKRNNFFSARRSLKFNHNDYGRNISIIMIN